MTDAPGMLVTKVEIARRFGVTRQAVNRWVRYESFPEPVDGIVGGVVVYDLLAVQAWKAAQPQGRNES